LELLDDVLRDGVQRFNRAMACRFARQLVHRSPILLSMSSYVKEIVLKARCNEGIAWQ
jgi:hypothetical protein